VIVQSPGGRKAKAKEKERREEVRKRKKKKLSALLSRLFSERKRAPMIDLSENKKGRPPFKLTPSIDVEGLRDDVPIAKIEIDLPKRERRQRSERRRRRGLVLVLQMMLKLRCDDGR